MASSLDHNAFESKLGQLLWKALKNSDENELFECLINENKVLRTAAACEIQIRASLGSFERVLILADSFRFESREIAAFILGQIGSPTEKYYGRSIESLTKLLNDSYYEVRATSVGSFGFLASNRPDQHPLICSKIISLLVDSEPTVRESLAFSLAYIYTETAFNGLITLSKDLDTNVRKAAVSGLEEHEERRKELDGLE